MTEKTIENIMDLPVKKRNEIIKSMLSEYEGNTKTLTMIQSIMDNEELSVEEKLSTIDQLLQVD